MIRSNSDVAETVTISSPGCKSSLCVTTYYVGMLFNKNNNNKLFLVIVNSDEDNSVRFSSTVTEESC